MEALGVMLSYAISKETFTKNTPLVSGSGIKINDDWIFCHGTLFSPLKVPLKILQSTKKHKIDKLYRSLPDVHVTQNSDDDLNLSKGLNSLNIKTGRAVFMWTCPLLLEAFKCLFSNWSFGKLETSNEDDKIYLSSFILIHLGAKNVHDDDIESCLSNLYNNISKRYPMRGEEIYIESTPFGNEVFLNSKTFGVVSNDIGEENCLVLCDASSSLSCEGGPVFLKDTNLLFGIVVTSVSWCRGEWVGLTLVACLAPSLYRLDIINNKGFPNEVIWSPKSMLINYILNEIDSVMVLVRCGISWGSGISLGKGYILTCSHIIERNCDVFVVFKGNKYKANVLLKSHNDTAYDLALLQVSFLEHDSPSSVKLLSNSVIKGEKVIAVGFPYFNEHDIKNIKPTITGGHISNVTPWMIQSSCCVQAGFSGGALMRIYEGVQSVSCELLGIIVCNVRNEENLVQFPFVNMSIPAGFLKDAVAKILEKGSLAPTVETCPNFEKKTKEAESIWRFQYPRKKITRGSTSSLSKL